MKKSIIKVVGIVLVVLLGLTVLTGCGKEETGANPATSEHIFKIGGKELRLGVDYSSLNLDEEESYYEVFSCAFEGMDKVYTFKDYEITTFPDGDRDRVLSILFLNEDLETPEGVKLYDTKAKMIEVYGAHYKNKELVYEYIKGKTSLKFIIEEDIITSIEYVYDAT